MNDTARLAPYRGRFAPSPTGPLHFGSLLAAVGSFLQARRQGGVWHIRIEDLDPPREVPGAADAILRILDALGLHWDGEVVYQSRRHEAYRAALNALEQTGALYPCACTRKEIADSSLAGIDGPVYPGTCRPGVAAERTARAWRVRTESAPIAFTDRWQGRIERRLQQQSGDFVVRRADGLYAYQLAVVVDDAALGTTEVVRGADLLESTPRQIHLQHLLGLSTPAYAHLPVAVNAQGEKFSKQTGAAAVDANDPLPMLHRVLARLGQEPPIEALQGELEALWRWAIAHWRPEAVAPARTIAVE
jgi:glutamyl-Q tRNA(Asp) synthetase